MDDYRLIIKRAIVGGATLGALYYTFQLLKELGLIGRNEWKQVGSLHQLFIYPVKGCAGVSVQQIDLDKLGPIGDRRFMIIDEYGGFVTQRQEPKMALIQVSLLPDKTVEFKSQSMDKPLVVKPVTKGPARRVRVWDDQVDAVDQGDAAAEWLQKYFGRPLRLVGLGEQGYDRPTSQKYTPGPAFGQTSFTDGFPMLMISQESLDELNRRLAVPLPVNRFRPSLVVKGCAPFSEDIWRDVRVGSVDMFVVKPCSRCKVTTTDQASGRPDPAEQPEPLRTLATFRSKRHLGTKVGDDVDVFFGQNVCHAGVGSLRVGDAVYARVWRLF